MLQKKLSRRNLLKGAAATAGFTIVPRFVLGGPGYTPPSERLTKAIIGVGSMGRGHAGYEGTKLLAVCDVDRTRVDAMLKSVNKNSNDCKGYTHYEEVLERPDIDIIHVPTPPHWHALISIAAAEAGKDIWCEKPMSRTIGEGEKVVEAVQRNGRMFRINTWFRFRSNFYGLGTPVKELKKAVTAGLFGWPLKVTIGKWTGFNWKLELWQGQPDLKPTPVPAELDYDRWLGPAPYMPYNPVHVHARFRGYWHYDGGGLGDMGQHYIDPVQYFLGKDHESPISVEADTNPQDPYYVKPWRRIVYKYADGCEIVLDGDNSLKDAPYIEGPKGKLYRGFKSTIPNIRRIINSLPDPEPRITSFSESVRTRKPFALNEVYAHRSCTLVNLGKIAVQLGRPLHFDPVKQRFVDDDEANRFIHQPMRAKYNYLGGAV